VYNESSSACVRFNCDGQAQCFPFWIRTAIGTCLACSFPLSISVIAMAEASQQREA